LSRPKACDLREIKDNAQAREGSDWVELGRRAAHTHARTEIEAYCRGGGDDEGLEHQAACVGHDVFLQLLVLRVFILGKRTGM
jgi:hypothetical protein